MVFINSMNRLKENNNNVPVNCAGSILVASHSCTPVQMASAFNVANVSVIPNVAQRSEESSYSVINSHFHDQGISPCGRNDVDNNVVISSEAKRNEKSPQSVTSIQAKPSTLFPNQRISPFGRNDVANNVVISSEAKRNEKSPQRVKNFQLITKTHFQNQGISPFGRNDVANNVVISSEAKRNEKSPQRITSFQPITNTHFQNQGISSFSRNDVTKGFAFLFAFIFLCITTSAQRKNISLNAGWETVLVNPDFNAGDDANSKSFQSDVKKINVPHNWDDYYGYRRMVHGNLHTSALYLKDFNIKRQNGKRYFLFFEGVGSYATVWVNQKKVGYHAGGRTTFTIDVTDALAANGNNKLMVRADHPAFIKDLPWVCGGCSEERGFSEGSQPLGIFRPVSLIETNEVRVEPFGIHAWADVQPAQSLLNINATLKNYAASAKSITLVHQLLDKKNNIIRATTKNYRLRSKDSITVSEKNLTVKNPVRWSVENPYLYKIKTIVKENNKIVDEAITDFGFRTAEWRTATNQFFLNDKPVFVNGVAEYEHLIGQSHAFSDEQVLSRMKWLQAAGFNAFRDGHQPHNLLYGKYFNEHGILWWTQMSAHIWYNTPEFRENFKKLLRDWVIERRNDPAVVMWGLQNESTLPKDFAEECTRLIRELDPTASKERLVTTCNGGEGSDWDVPQNWTGTYGGNPDTYGEDLKKQILVGEYGAWRTLDLHTEGGYVQNGPVSEDRFTLLMEKKLRLAESVKDSVAGHYFWLLTSHDNPGRVQGGEGFREMDRIGPVNYKGMLTPWEEPTDIYYMFRSNYTDNRKEPMVYIASHTWPNRWMTPGVKDSVHVYSNCDEVELFNDLGAASFGRKKRGAIGTHFIWDKINVQYNILYAVGYVNGKAVAKDTIVLHHLPKAPAFDKLYSKGTDVSKPAPGLNYIYRVNCGGPDYLDAYGAQWTGDNSIPDSAITGGKHFSGSKSWTNDFPEMPAVFASQRRTFAPLNGTKDWKLFQSFRYGREKLQYEMPLADGNYIVELYFIEPWIGVGGGIDGKGLRIFDVAFNGKTVLNDLDIWEEAGTNTVLKKTIPVSVTGGKLVIHFPEVKVGQALISAIAVSSKLSGVRAAPEFRLMDVKEFSVKPQTWLDIGDVVFTDKNILFNQLPPVLFGAEWLQTTYNNEKLQFNINAEADVYIGVDEKLQQPGDLKEFENTGSYIVTDENGGKKYLVYKKRFPKNSAFNFTNARDWLVAVHYASNMQPAYDLKAVKSYKADVAVLSEGVANEMMSGNLRSFIKTDGPVQIDFPVQTGVADIYSITVKYFSSFEKDIIGTLELIDVSGKTLLAEKINYKFTREGKWNLFTTQTDGMINAGSYTVRLKLQNAKGLILSNVDVQ